MASQEELFNDTLNIIVNLMVPFSNLTEQNLYFIIPVSMFVVFV